MDAFHIFVNGNVSLVVLFGLKTKRANAFIRLVQHMLNMFIVYMS